MKKLIFSLVFLTTGALFSFSQDLIVLKDATEIQATNIKVSSSYISFDKWNNSSNTSYSIPTTDVFYIKYADGRKEVLNTQTSEQPADATSEKKQQAKSSAAPVAFDGYLDVGLLVNSYLVGPSSNLSLGVRIKDVAYVGIESGYNYLFYYGRRYGELNGWVVPLGAHIRGYIPTGRNIYPFAGLTLGCAFGAKDAFYAVFSDLNEVIFHCQIISGCDFGRFSLGFGWDRLGYNDNFVLRLGIRLGQ